MLGKMRLLVIFSLLAAMLIVFGMLAFTHPNQTNPCDNPVISKRTWGVGASCPKP